MKEEIAWIKTSPAHPACLDFHHRAGEVKEFTVAALCQRCSWTLIQLEIEKCDVVCSNCHRKQHYDEETGVWRPRQVGSPFVVKIPLGKRQGKMIDQMLKRLATGPQTVRELAEAMNISADYVRALVHRFPTAVQRNGKHIGIRQQS